MAVGPEQDRAGTEARELCSGVGSVVGGDDRKARGQREAANEVSFGEEDRRVADDVVDRPPVGEPRLAEELPREPAGAEALAEGGCDRLPSACGKASRSPASVAVALMSPPRRAAVVTYSRAFGRRSEP